MSFETEDDQDGIWRVLAAILNLMNVEFMYDDEVDGAMIVDDTPTSQGNVDVP